MLNINWVFDSTWGNESNHDWEALKKEGTVTETTEEKNLRCNDSSIVTFSFKYHPEFIEKKMVFFFRDGNTKGVGEVIDLIND